MTDILRHFGCKLATLEKSNKHSLKSDTNWSVKAFLTFRKKQ